MSMFSKSGSSKGKSVGPQKPKNMSPVTRAMPSKAKELKSSKTPRLKSIPGTVGMNFAGTAK